MKANEIIIRQDRVVYTLMILLASLGLLWSLWQHKQNTAIPDTAPEAQHVASKAPADHTIYVR